VAERLTGVPPLFVHRQKRPYSGRQFLPGGTFWTNLPGSGRSG